MDIHNEIFIKNKGYIWISMQINKGNLAIKEKVLGYYTAEVSKSGNSARINCQKKYLGKKVVVVVLEEENE